MFFALSAGEIAVMKHVDAIAVWLMVFAVGVTVPACGGGGGGGSTTTTTTTSTTAYPRFAYVANSGDGRVSTYVVDATTGRLRYIGKAAVGSSLTSVTVDPSGKYAYVVNYGGNNVPQFTIGTNRSLIPMATPTVASGLRPFSVTIDPSGQYAYVANWASDDVSQHTSGADGTLTPMVTATVAAGTNFFFVTTTTSTTGTWQ